MTSVLIGLGFVGMFIFAWYMHRTGQRSYFIYKLVGGGILILFWLWRDYVMSTVH